MCMTNLVAAFAELAAQDRKGAREARGQSCSLPNPQVALVLIITPVESLSAKLLLSNLDTERPTSRYVLLVLR